MIADSLLALLYGPKPIKNTANLYYWSRQLQRHNTGAIITATFDEMKYDIFFRLIKKSISKQTVDYYNQIAKLKYYEEQFENTADNSEIYITKLLILFLLTMH